MSRPVKESIYTVKFGTYKIKNGFYPYTVETGFGVIKKRPPLCSFPI